MNSIKAFMMTVAVAIATSVILGFITGASGFGQLDAFAERSPENAVDFGVLIVDFSVAMAQFLLAAASWQFLVDVDAPGQLIAPLRSWTIFLFGWTMLDKFW